MSSDYVVWMHKIEKNACDLQEFRNFEKSYRLGEGMSLASVWPDDVEMEMNEDHPDDTWLTDSLFNIKSLVVISNRVKDFLESKVLSSVEFLPVNIKNHKGRHTDEDYFILNLTEKVDCLDIDASEAEESMMTDDIVEVNGIVLKNAELMKGHSLIRLKRFGYPTLVERSLADEIDAQGFTGIRWGELKDFTDKIW